MGETPAKEQNFKIVGIFSGKKQEKFTGMTSDLSGSLWGATKLWSQSASDRSPLASKIAIDALLKQVKKLGSGLAVSVWSGQAF